jgi:DNA-binding MarR family transcriptional regulator
MISPQPPGGSPRLEELVDLHQEYLRALSMIALPAWVELDLTLPQLRMLYLLVHDGEQTASGLARRLGVAPSTVTGLVDRLVERGVVARSEDRNDRRTIWVRATDDGQVLINSLIASRREQLARVLSELSDADRELVGGALRALLDAVQVGTQPDRSCRRAPARPMSDSSMPGDPA